MTVPVDPKSIAGKNVAPTRRVPVVVVGGGPAGVAAATASARAGAAVLLLDEHPLDPELMAMDVPLFFGQRMSSAVRDRGVMLERVVRANPGLEEAIEAGVEVELGVSVWGAFRPGPVMRELGGGDTHGSLFGSTKNPYDLERTAGGSSGGSAASVSANFCTVAVGQEGFASIRRPSTWNCVAGMRPTAGLVSRSGVYAGWPSINGSLGPMARTVTDLAKLLDVMAGYDPDDPLTARGVGRIRETFTEALDRNGGDPIRLQRIFE